MIMFFKDNNHKSREKHKKYKTLNTVLISSEPFVIIATTSSSSPVFLICIGG